jgi:hypothetical protein
MLLKYYEIVIDRTLKGSILNDGSGQEKQQYRTVLDSMKAIGRRLSAV